ncbi:TPA: hypothetical protein MW255_001055 [Acinetobacter baumannii]|nr:hypothetical protein [Acinetobacter baumannii]
MDTTQINPVLDAMVDGMIAISTRADGNQTLTKEQATLLIQAHISSVAPCQCMQNSTTPQQENCCDSYPHHPTSFLSVQQMNQDQAAHLQSVHQLEQSTPTPSPQYK